ncbi:MAG: ERF family protein [Thermoplasmata archaeon]
MSNIIKQEENKTSSSLATASNVENLIKLAIENKVDVSSLEKLLQMRIELKKEWAREQFFLALSTLQSELPKIKKSNIVRNKDGTIRYKYAPLDEIVEQVKNFLKKNGFSYYIDAKIENGWVTAICKVIHSSGHEETSSFSIPIDKEGFMSEPQKVASALTFAKRYAFCNAFGILTSDEDTDANTFEDVKIKGKEIIVDNTREIKIIKPPIQVKKCPECLTTGMYHRKDCSYAQKVKTEEVEVEKNKEFSQVPTEDIGLKELPTEMKKKITEKYKNYKLKNS